MRRHDNAHRAVHARQFLDHDGIVDVSEARPAVFFGEDHAHQTHGRQLRHQFFRELRVLVPAPDVGRNFRFRKFTDILAKLDLLWRQFKVHWRPWDVARLGSYSRAHITDYI